MNTEGVSTLSKLDRTHVSKYNLFFVYLYEVSVMKPLVD